MAPAAIALLLGMSFSSPATAGDWGDSSYGDSYGDKDKDKDKGERPSWGFGDQNHDHSGPPGLDN